jgi:hypothetical protein
MSKMKDEAIRLANIEANRPPCPFCNGTQSYPDDRPGRYQGDSTPCRECRDGKMEVCWNCEGYGYLLDQTACRKCEGTGYYSPNMPATRRDIGRYCPVPMGLKVVLLGIAFLWLWAIAEITMAVMR